MDVTVLSTLELLQTHGSVLEELRRRDIVRNSNSPISDLAEVLFCRAFNWVREGNSVAGYDARDAAGARYQIKARRLTAGPGARQLSAIRNLDRNPFDQLAAVLFEPNFSIHGAALIPFAIVKARVRPSTHTNSYVFHLRDEVWAERGVIDVTAEIRKAASGL